MGALSARHSAGFTILELLVAMTISMMIVGMLLTVAGEMLGDYDMIQGRTRMEGDADFALDLIASDLAALSIPNRGEGLRGTNATVNEATNAQWLTLLAGTFDKDTNYPRAMRAVSYKMACQNPVDGSASSAIYGLYRTLAEPGDTFSNAVGKTNLVAGYWDATNSTEPKNFLVGNVVAFNTRFLCSGTTNWTDPMSTVTIDRDFAKTNGIEVPGGFSRAEVTVTVLTPKGAKLLSDGAIKMTNATSGTNHYSRSYSRQVSILPGAAK
ncbi:MAG: prepilin-type N-terminal cleavage/methylation domain-containing protein [Verrucomicrobiae bacterium]